MKKLTVFLFLTLLLLVFSFGAFAADRTLNEGESSGSTIITATVGSNFTLIIPSDTVINVNATSSAIGNIGINDIRIGTGEKITVTASSPADGFILKNNSTGEIPYSLKIDGAATNNADFTANGTKAVTVEIAASAWNAAPAGSYTDTITFTAAIT